MSAEVDWREVYDWAGLRVREYLTHRYPPGTLMLDVGAGHGKYARLLPEYRFDAVEVWEPTVEEYGLRDLYGRVWVQDVARLARTKDWHSGEPQYEVAILGDVLEHLERDQAKAALYFLGFRCLEILVVVPYLYPQGPEDGNAHQTHLQDDLTPELMTVSYPSLELMAVETREQRPFKGLYRSDRGIRGERRVGGSR